MTIHQDSSELLAAIPRALDGVAVTVLDVAGAPSARFGAFEAADAAHASVRAELPSGAVVADLANACPEAQALVHALLGVVKERERLEADMESMNDRSMSLLEQVAMYTETLPQLSAGDSDAAVARQAVEACRRAAGVRHVVYFEYLQDKGGCVLAADYGDLVGAGRGELDPFLPAEGFLGDVLAGGVPLVRGVPRGKRLGEPGSPERLAEKIVLGVPVTYGSAEKRVPLGVLVLIDRSDGRVEVRADDGEDGVGALGSWEIDFAVAFGAMLGAVLGARKTVSLGKEMSTARTIQRQVLPERPAVVAGYDVAARYEACGAVGGDYFEYVPLVDGRTLVAVADVSGHNLASGMVMVSARAHLRTLATVHSCPAKLFSAMAKVMHDDLQRTERFLTAAAVALRPGEGAVEYVCAGHNDLMIYRAAGDRVERVPSDGTILGFMPDVAYESRALRLHPGDCLLLYTDGITEATDRAGQMFGEERLAAVLAQLAPNRSAQRVVDGLATELENWRGGAANDDDVTAVVVRFEGLMDGGNKP